MVVSMLSARRAAQRLGFATSNPILDAIRNEELPAERSESRSRNGVNNATYRIREADLLKWAAARGLAEPIVQTANGSVDVETGELLAEPEPEPAAAEAPETFNVAGVVTPARLGFVTIPIEHYAALVADRAELEFTKRHFELRIRK